MTRGTLPVWKKYYHRSLNAHTDLVVNEAPKTRGQQVCSIVHPDVLSIHTNIQNHHLAHLIKHNYIALTRGNELVINPDGHVEAHGLPPISIEVLDSAAPTCHLGPDSPGPSHHDPAPPAATRDSDLYGPLMEVMSNVPSKAHRAFNRTSGQLAALPEGERSEETLRAPMRKAAEEEQKGLQVLRELLA